MPSHEAVASILKTLLGQKQLGAPAPAFQPGEMLGQAGGLGNIQDELLKPQGLLSLLQSLNQGPEAPISEAVESLPAEQAGPPSPQFGPPDELFESGPDKKAGIKGFLSQFGKGIDETLSSRSKQLGIGLLGQIDPRLSLAGLLAGGLFGGR